MTTGGHDNLVGIDLGTTLSVIARLDKSGSAVTIPNRRGDPLTPSVVYLDGTTARVGETARIAAARDSSKAAVSVKREMGTSLYSRMVDGRRLRPETALGDHPPQAEAGRRAPSVNRSPSVRTAGCPCACRPRTKARRFAARPASTCSRRDWGGPTRELHVAGNRRTASRAQTVSQAPGDSRFDRTPEAWASREGGLVIPRTPSACG